MKNRIIIMLIYFITLGNAFSQNQILTYTGKLVDSQTKKSVKNANIIIRGEDYLVQSNFLGYFQVTGAPLRTIIVSHAGYKLSAIKLPVSNQKFVVKLERDYKSIPPTDLSPNDNSEAFEYSQNEWSVLLSRNTDEVTDPSSSEVIAQFPGGFEKFFQYVREKSGITNEDMLELQGSELFISITKDGYAKLDSSTVRSSSLENKLKEVIRSSPQWVPAAQWGELVDSGISTKLFQDELLSLEAGKKSPAYPGGIERLYEKMSTELIIPENLQLNQKQIVLNATLTFDEYGAIVGYDITNADDKELEKILSSFIITLPNFEIKPTTQDQISSKASFGFVFSLPADEQTIAPEQLNQDDTPLNISIDSYNEDDNKKNYDSFEKAYQDNPAMEELLLSGKGIESIPDMIGNFKNLTSLDVSNNAIDALPESINTLKKLKRLYIANNHLSELTPATSKLELSTLDLSGNRLNAFPESVLEMKELKVLNLSGNQINKIPAEISKLKNLKAIYLNQTPVDSLPSELFKLKKLKFIFLSDTKIKDELITQYRKKNQSIEILN